MTDGGPPPEQDPGGADASVLRRTLLIVNKRGLHARAAAKFVTLAERFGASRPHPGNMPPICDAKRALCKP